MEEMSEKVRCLVKHSRNLYNWYKKNHRKLPFRDSKNPYEIWISEIMLQQTRVQAMIEKYNLFIREFPGVKILAESSEQKVLSQWKGLGYYNRARNLHRTARIIQKDFKGVFPFEKQALIKLPGIGDYTASAIASIAFQKPCAVYDGNVHRFLTRFTGQQNKRTLKKTADLWMENSGAKDPSVHNQAVMELGATVCIPGIPHCQICPVSRGCDSMQKGGNLYAANLPHVPKNKPVPVLLEALLIQSSTKTNRKILLEKSKDSFFLKSHWFFPNQITRIDTGECLYCSPEIDFQEMKRNAKIERRRSFKHRITKYSIEVEVFTLTLNQQAMSRILKPEPEGENPVHRELVDSHRVEQSIHSSLGQKILLELEGPE